MHEHYETNRPKDGPAMGSKAAKKRLPAFLAMIPQQG
jgi:hypothetical protein